MMSARKNFHSYARVRHKEHSRPEYQKCQTIDLEFILDMLDTPTESLRKLRLIRRTYLIRTRLPGLPLSQFTGAVVIPQTLVVGRIWPRVVQSD